MEFSIANFKQRPDLFAAQEAVCGRAFPVFLYYSDVAAEFWERMIAYYREYQLMLLEQDEIVAVINCLPINLDIPVTELPDDAFGWAFEKCIADYEAQKIVNTVVGVQIVVAETYQGRGASSAAVKTLKSLCRQKGVGKVIIPVRPTLKSKYPLVDMDDYRGWTRSDDLPFDPWLRVHVRNNARIVKVCERAVEIRGSVRQWETWTEMAFPQSGEYVVEGALCPVTIDRSKDLGIYIEPNVWVSYHLQSNNR